MSSIKVTLDYVDFKIYKDLSAELVDVSIQIKNLYQSSDMSKESLMEAIRVMGQRLSQYRGSDIFKQKNKWGGISERS